MSWMNNGHSMLPLAAMLYWILKPELVIVPSDRKDTNTTFPLAVISLGRRLPQNERINGAVSSLPS